MADQEPVPVNKNRILPSGVELTRITQEMYDISSGESHPFVPLSLKYDPGTRTENELLSGEAIIFPNAPTTIMLGRHSTVDVRIDSDFVPLNDVKSIGDEGYASTMREIAQQLEQEGLGTLTNVVDLSDPYISRHALQVSRHPDGVTLVAFDANMGNRHYEKSREAKVLESTVAGPLILRNYEPEPLTVRLEPAFYTGAQILRNGEIIVFEGRKRTTCLRFFASSEAGSLEFKPAMMVKQSFPSGISMKDLHEQIILSKQEN